MPLEKTLTLHNAIILIKSVFNKDQCGYVKAFKVKNKKLMFFRVNDEELLEKYKDIWNKIEGVKSVASNTLQVYEDRYLKTK